MRALFVSLGLILTARTAAAERAGGVGVGALLGEPVAATAMLRWNEREAIQGVVGWSFGQKRMHVGADYLYTATEIEADDRMGLRYPVYVGAGLRVRMLGEDTTAGKERGNVGLRFPFGVSVEPDHLPLEVYFEMAPVWVMIPVSHGGFDGGIGLRVFL